MLSHVGPLVFAVSAIPCLLAFMRCFPLILNPILVISSLLQRPKDQSIVHKVQPFNDLHIDKVHMVLDIFCITVFFYSNIQSNIM